MAYSPKLDCHTIVGIRVNQFCQSLVFYSRVVKKTTKSEIRLRLGVYDLFGLILEDENISTRRREHIDEHKKVLDDISEQELYISKARKFFLDEKLDFDDFSKLKKVRNERMEQLNYQLTRITKTLTGCGHNNNLWPDIDFNVFRSYKEQDIKRKSDIVSLFTPASISTATTDIDSIEIDAVISLVVEYRK